MDYPVKVQTEEANQIVVADHFEKSNLFIEYVKRATPYTMSQNHFHTYYEIYYLIDGQRTYFIEDSTHTIYPGNMVFINKNELHKTLYAGEDLHERLIFHFDDTFMNRFGHHQVQFLLSIFQQNQSVLRLSPTQQMLINGHMNRIISEMQHKPDGFELYLSYGVIDILLQCARLFQQQKPDEEEKLTPVQQKITEITRYINTHYDEGIDLDKLSKKFYISKSYLSRTFKRLTGFALTDYLNLIRIREAQRLLRESKYRIIDIASMAGFENVSHFGRVFKKISGITPRAYRKSSQGSQFSTLNR